MLLYMTKINNFRWLQKTIDMLISPLLFNYEFSTEFLNSHNELWDKLNAYTKLVEAADITGKMFLLEVLERYSAGE